MINILFLCTGNSARSVLSEALMNHHGQGRCRAWSAGSRPVGKVNPLARQVLAEAGMEDYEDRSKSWDEFASAGAPVMDLVITVCGSAAGEACPAWPGHPASAHWGTEDPAAVTSSEEAGLAAFRRALRILQHRVLQFVDLPVESMADEELKRALAAIGASLPEDAGEDES